MKLKNQATNKQALAFIGGGHMATSLIGGLIANGYDPQAIWVADPDQSKLDRLYHHFGINTTLDNFQAAQKAEVVVLAVKPQQIKTVSIALKQLARPSQPLWISVAAGIRISDLEYWLGCPAPILRAMPNTPALVQAGATALFASPQTTSQQRQLAESILRAVGMTLWLSSEHLMEAVTALSGGGPAYFFLVMEAMEKAAIHLGLDPDSARLLTLETALGAAKMALESKEDSASLRRQVTSPGGTTERAIDTLEKFGIHQAFADALEAARNRTQELAKELGATHD